MVTAYIALGANLGTPLKTLRAASHALATLPHTRLGAGSRIYRSAPVDATGPDFYNAVLSLHTQLDAHELLAHMQSLENIHGRSEERRVGKERRSRGAPGLGKRYERCVEERGIATKQVAWR